MVTTSWDGSEPVLVAGLNGPLTTVFTPPAWCAQHYIDLVVPLDDQYHCMVDSYPLSICGEEIDSCFPSVIGLPSGYIGPGFMGLPQRQIYSPGLYCPVGWTTAGSVTSSLASWTYAFSGNSSSVYTETFPAGVLCCPSGLTSINTSCGASFTQGNASVVVNGMHSYYCDPTTSVITFGENATGFLTQSTFTETEVSYALSKVNFNVFVPGIVLGGQSLPTDFFQTRTTSETGVLILPEATDTSGSTPAASETPNDQDPQSDDGSNDGSGLSSGARIGVGVGVGVGGLILLAVCAVFFWRYRKKRLSKRNNQAGEASNGDRYEKPELEGTPGYGNSQQIAVGAQQSSPEPKPGFYEIDSRPGPIELELLHPPPELGGDSRSELPASNGPK